MGESIAQLPPSEEVVRSLRSFVVSPRSTKRGPPGETIYHSVVSCRRRVTVNRSIRGISGIVSILVVFAIVSSLPPADGALRKPTYAAGDKWVYVLSGSLAGFPGFNTSQGTFHLDVGQNASAAFTAHVELNSTFTAFFQTMTSQNVTDLASTWHRDVLSRENVSVEAGTFSSYKLNQTLGSFPGIPSGLSGGGNETAYFSNDVGFYVKRVAYENGTPAAEMRLRSYSYGAGPPTGISATQV